MKEFLKSCEPYRGRIAGCAVGILAAIIWMLIGFWRTLLLVILALVGFGIGLAIDDKEKFRALISRIQLIFERE